MKEVFEIINKPVKNLDIKELNHNIFLVTMETQAELALTFLRFQEYYESPKFRKQIFSYQEYMDWYAKEQSEKKIFDYHKTWNGFNIPSWVLEPFYNNDFLLTVKEKSFLEYFSNLEDKFYIIGVHKDKDPKEYDALIKHETGHGLYYANNEYKQKVNKSLSNYDLTPLNNFLSKIGYHEDVHLDECHAYLLAHENYLNEKGINTEDYRELVKYLNDLYNHFTNN